MPENLDTKEKEPQESKLDLAIENFWIDQKALLNNKDELNREQYILLLEWNWNRNVWVVLEQIKCDVFAGKETDISVDFNKYDTGVDDFIAQRPTLESFISHRKNISKNKYPTDSIKEFEINMEKLKIKFPNELESGKHEEMRMQTFVSNCPNDSFSRLIKQDIENLRTLNNDMRSKFLDQINERFTIQTFISDRNNNFTTTKEGDLSGMLKQEVEAFQNAPENMKEEAGQRLYESRLTKREEQKLQNEIKNKLAELHDEQHRETINHIDVIKLKKEIEASTLKVDGVNVIRKNFLNTDGNTYIINFSYEPESYYAWYYRYRQWEGWQAFINLFVCEENYNLVQARNTTFNLWFANITLDEFVLSIVDQETWYKGHELPEDLVDNLDIISRSLSHLHLVREALSELPSLERGAENYFYAIRFFSIIDQIITKEEMKNTYEYNNLPEYELMYKRYIQAVENIVKDKYADAWWNAIEQAKIVIQTWRECDNWMWLRRKYKYIWSSNNRDKYFDTARNNAQIDCFKWNKIKDEYKNIFVRAGDLFDNKWVLDDKIEEEKICKPFAFLKRQDFLDIINEYKRIVKEATNKEKY